MASIAYTWRSISRGSKLHFCGQSSNAGDAGREAVGWRRWRPLDTSLQGFPAVACGRLRRLLLLELLASCRGLRSLAWLAACCDASCCANSIRNWLAIASCMRWLFAWGLRRFLLRVLSSSSCDVASCKLLQTLLPRLYGDIRLASSSDFPYQTQWDTWRGLGYPVFFKNKI